MDMVVRASGKNDTPHGDLFHRPTLVRLLGHVSQDTQKAERILNVKERGGTNTSLLMLFVDWPSMNE